MPSVKTWRDLIGTIEIVAGSFLVFPSVLILVATILTASSGIPSFMLSESITDAPKIFGLTIHDHYYGGDWTNTMGGFFILNGFFWIGIIILINGIWKIRSNKYLK